ncbi:MAG: FtsX-like permease family protein [ANME-2 cluster archaeon]|nr:FtsX-like permease family protein [ANME-2 cluster archaeon]
MSIITITVKDLTRRKAKLLLALLSVAIAVSAFAAITTIFSAAEDGLWDEASKYGANIIIKQKTDQVPLLAGSTTVGTLSTGDNYINESELDLIWTIEYKANIAVVAPKLYGIVEVNGTKAVLLGINSTQESRLKPWWKIDGEWPGEGEVLLGTDIAQALQLGPGDIFTINTHQMYEITVSGVLEGTGAAEDAFMIMNLHDAQDVLERPGLISTAEVRALCNNCPVEEISRQIEGALPSVEARAISQIVMGEMAMIAKTKSSAMAVALVTLLVSAMTVASTMLAAINDKTKEIGIMRAVGASDGQITSMVMLEGTIIGFIGGIIGFIAGTVAAMLFGPMLFDSVVKPLYDLLPQVIVVSMVICMMAAYLPARRALDIDPVEVLRDV